MADLTFSSTLEPSTPYSDSLAAGGTGIDYGIITNSSYTPNTDTVNNLGHLDLYLSHDGVAPITDLRAFIQAYGSDTGFTYGGVATAVGDYNTFVAQGSATGDSKNNLDGLSGGIWHEMQWDVTNVSRFDLASRPTLVFAHGKDGLGISQATGIPMLSSMMVYDSGGETVASAPVDGSLGEAGNTVLGDVAHDQMRIYMPALFDASGIMQFELTFSYVDT